MCLSSGSVKDLRRKASLSCVARNLILFRTRTALRKSQEEIRQQAKAQVGSHQKTKVAAVPLLPLPLFYFIFAQIWPNFHPPPPNFMRNRTSKGTAVFLKSNACTTSPREILQGGSSFYSRSLPRQEKCDRIYRAHDSLACRRYYLVVKIWKWILFWGWTRTLVCGPRLEDPIISPT